MEFATGIAENVLGKLASYASREALLAWGAQLELSKLRETLTSISLLLQDAERKQVKNPVITNWLTKLKDVCCDVQDIIDELEYRKLYNKMLVNLHGRVKGKVRHFFSRWNPTLFNFKLGHRVKEIRERLVEIDNEKNKFGLDPLIKIAQGEEQHSLPQMTPNNERETYSSVVASQVIGRDADKETILGYLSHATTEENVSVVSIVGFGGLGKTMLTKLVYNDNIVEENFEVKMWVCVSDHFEVKPLIRKIVSAATCRNCEDGSFDLMSTTLKASLKDKKFLLVLDDVWDTEHVGVTHQKWSDLTTVLSVGANGSKIIVTTRNESVATIVESLDIHPLKGLSHPECMSLFIKKAFKKGEDKRFPHLIKIGEEIVNKCGGVPLAVATLGGMLSSTRESDQWLSAKDNELWSIGNDDILPALRLSYDALPPHLKQCFVFCSLFPKDFEFHSYYLVRLWVAQGYLGPWNQDLYKTGLDYIRQLCSRSLFQIESDLGTTLRFKMHDLIHDMVISVAQTEYSTVNFRPSIAFKMVRHMSISKKDFIAEDKLPDFVFESTKLRTFLIPEDGEINQDLVKTCIARFKFMRVLDLCGSQLEELPSSISRLFHLRDLNLSGNEAIKRLPNSICKLLNLESLNFNECAALEEIPKDIGNLINLRSLGITTQQKYLPKGVSRLTALQQIWFINCVNLISLGEEIQFFTNLRILGIKCCESLVSLPQNMKVLTVLHTLIIHECKQLDLIKTKEGPQGLKLFGISKSNLEALPSWLEDSAKALQTIFIAECDKLTQLPELQQFTLLEKLSIYSCPNLLNLPQGMHCLTELRNLEISDCPKLSKSCKWLFKGDEWSKFTTEADVTLDSDVDTDDEELYYDFIDMETSEEEGRFSIGCSRTAARCFGMRLCNSNRQLPFATTCMEIAVVMTLYYWLFACLV